MSLRDLPTLGEIQQTRRAPAKGLPHMLEKKAKQASAEEKAEAFRKAVWKRDKGRSRATGKPLVKSGTTAWDKLGEVDHAIPRSLAPERIYDVENGILLSKEENRLRKVCCPQDPEHQLFNYTGPENRGEPQTFTWRDAAGTITKQRMG